METEKSVGLLFLNSNLRNVSNLLSYYILVDIFFPVILTTIPLFIAWNDFYEILILLLLQLMRISGFAAIIFTLRDDEN